MIAADAPCTYGIKSDDTMVKAGFDEKKITSKLDLHLRKKLVKCHI
jgi:hypothetical protein